MTAKVAVPFILVFSTTVLLWATASAQPNRNIASVGVSQQQSLVVPVACRLVADPAWIEWYNANNRRDARGNTIPYAPRQIQQCDDPQSNSSGSSSDCVNGRWKPPGCQGRWYKCGTVC